MQAKAFAVRRVVIHLDKSAEILITGKYPAGVRFDLKRFKGTKEGPETVITIQSSVQHSLGQEEAVDRIHQLVASLSERFPQQVHQVQLHLNDHCVDVDFAAYGYQVAWHAEVYDDQVSLTGKIPDSAKKFEQKIEEAIVTRIEETLLPSPISRVA